MGWSIYTHASVVDVRRPRPLGSCDRCGFIYNRDQLRWQYDWAGKKPMNMGVLVCHKCMDHHQQQLQAITIPPDPVAIRDPRPGEYGGMVIGSSGDAFSTIVPSQIVIQSTGTDGTTNVGDRSPVVTETSSLPLLTEIGVVPSPNPDLNDGYIQDVSS